MPDELEYTGDDITIRHGYIIATLAVRIDTEHFADIYEALDEHGNSTTHFISSYLTQSNRTFNDRFLSDIDRYELEVVECEIDGWFDGDQFESRVIATLKQSSNILVLSFWIEIPTQQEVSEYIGAKGAIINNHNLSIAHNKGTVDDICEYLSATLNVDKQGLNTVEKVYVTSIIRDSSIADRLEEVTRQRAIDNEWERRQIYGLITANRLTWCRGIRKSEIDGIISKENDYRIGLATWVRKFNTTILMSEFSEKYLRKRADQTGETVPQRLRHTMSYEVIVSEILLIRAARVGEFQRAISDTIGHSSSSIEQISNLREQIVGYFDNFSSEKILLDYLKNQARFERLTNASGIYQLESQLQQDLDYLEDAIQNRRAVITQRRDSRIQTLLLFVEVTILVTGIYSIMSGRIRWVDLGLALSLTFVIVLLTPYLNARRVIDRFE